MTSILRDAAAFNCQHACMPVFHDRRSFRGGVGGVAFNTSATAVRLCGCASEAATQLRVARVFNVLLRACNKPLLP